MSIFIERTSITQLEFIKVVKDLKIDIEDRKGNIISSLTPVSKDVIKDKVLVSIPFNYGIKQGYKPKSSPPSHISPQFERELLPRQLDILETSLKELNTNHSILLALYPGFGKTIFSLYLSTHFKGKVGILIPVRKVLEDQWIDAVKTSLPSAKVQAVTSTNTIDTNNDFFVFSTAVARKRTTVELSFIDILICDEVHMLVSMKMHESLLKFHPSKLIALSATPERSDSLDGLINLFFGDITVDIKMQRKFFVYLMRTKFVPNIKHSNDGTLNWGEVLNSQCMNDERNSKIISVIESFKERNFLILTKRIEQGKYLFEELQKRGEDVDLFVSTSIKFNYDCRILISTFSKTGVGFDHPKLDALFLASDVEEGIEQYMGRIFRRDDVSPIVFDMVDKFPSFEKHWRTRKQMYLSRGGIIKEC